MSAHETCAQSERQLDSGGLETLLLVKGANGNWRPELREPPSGVIQQQPRKDEEPAEEQQVQPKVVVQPAIPIEENACPAALATAECFHRIKRR